MRAEAHSRQMRVIQDLNRAGLLSKLGGIDDEQMGGLQLSNGPGTVFGCVGTDEHVQIRGSVFACLKQCCDSKRDGIVSSKLRTHRQQRDVTRVLEACLEGLLKGVRLV